MRTVGRTYIPSKDRGAGEELPIARVQLRGEPEVTSSRSSPPTTWSEKNHHYKHLSPVGQTYIEVTN